MYGILQFTNKSRVNVTGIPFQSYQLQPLVKQIIVHSKKNYHIDMWAKINEKTFELIELIGPICDYETEVAVLRHVYHITCKYPKFEILPKTVPKDAKCFDSAFTVDGPTTLDRDDAISVIPTEFGTDIAIHITDLSVRFAYLDALLWAQQRASSAYWETGTKPMLPPYLAHEELSLTKGGWYPCISLVLSYDTQQNLINTTLYKESNVYIKENITYEEFSKARFLDFNYLQQLSNETDPTDVIAWTMIQYNLYMAKTFGNVILLRVQKEAGTSAFYDYNEVINEGSNEVINECSNDSIHASFNAVYTHMTSPIRRYVDFYNQCVVKGYNVDYNAGYNIPKLSEEALKRLNERMTEVSHFHYREIIISLAYKCKEKPMIVDALITIRDDEKAIKIHSEQLPKAVWIPLHDSYYSEPICEQLEQNKGQFQKITLYGIHKNGKATLRIVL